MPGDGFGDGVAARPLDDEFSVDGSVWRWVATYRAREVQIAVDEAVPYEEIKQNPYVVMCSTSTGGHLSWFEVGGTRWFSKPV